MPEISNNTPRWLEIMYSQTVSELQTTISTISSQLARVMDNIQEREDPNAMIAAYNYKLNIANALILENIRYNKATVLSAPATYAMYATGGKVA
jgi:hypothetical protein